VEEDTSGGFSYECSASERLMVAEWVLFLSPDTEIQGNCFENLLDPCEQQLDYKVISIKQIDSNGKNCYPCGIFPNTFNVVDALRGLELCFFKRAHSKLVLSSTSVGYPF